MSCDFYTAPLTYLKKILVSCERVINYPVNCRIFYSRFSYFEKAINNFTRITLQRFYEDNFCFTTFKLPVSFLTYLYLRIVTKDNEIFWKLQAIIFKGFLFILIISKSSQILVNKLQCSCIKLLTSLDYKVL